MDSKEQLLGISICDNCQSRIRVLEKHKRLVGKSVRCPKCHTLFSLSIEPPTTPEVQAIEAEEARSPTQSRKRRSKSEIRQAHIDRAMDGFRNLHGRLKEISSQPKSSEEQVRIWCIDALRDALGYQDDEIDTECKVLSGKVDIALKKNDRIFMVIECKNMRSKLGASVRDQAGTYAATLSADWAVITNGDLWKMYRVCAREGQTPHLELVFDVALLDEDGVSEIDAANLYLLTARAIFTGDADREFHEVACTSPNRLYDAIFSDRAIVAVRRQLIEAYEESEGQRLKLEDDEVKSLLKDLLTPLEL